MVIIKALFFRSSVITSCWELLQVCYCDIFSHVIHVVFCGCGNIFCWMSIYFWLYTLRQAPFHLTNLVGCSGTSCVNNADWEGCDFSFFLPTFFVSLLFFLLQGQPRQEDGGGVNEDPGFRSVCQKALLVILVFIFNIILIDLFVKVVKRSFSPLVASRFPLNDAGRAIVATLAARILEDQQEPGFIRWTWPPIGMVGRLRIDSKSCLFTS